uniref:Chorismate lyase n=1 Tax=Ahnfeltia plicata TaxID=28023 RepID=A0A1C9CB25_9FLOR|nr:hypothetical protein Ahnf_091 [Ahnfeltia plicata]AOM65576.1 hypothetical protein Ahnf_091 [Ahnfeltia plicata]UAT97402.1 hypothetical protein Ahn.pli.Chile.pt_031 [Ahnfeltia plicata]
MYTNDFIPLNTSQLNIYNDTICDPVPLRWKLILLNDGSFTQNLNSLTGHHINANVLKQSTNNFVLNQYTQHLDAYFSLVNSKATREVWLEDNKSTKLAFARSFWFQPSIMSNKFPDHEPIGKSFIQLNIDIHKEIHQVYCGYSTHMSHEFKSNDFIWGRHYTIWQNYQPLAIVQEFFSPHLIQYLQL